MNLSRCWMMTWHPCRKWSITHERWSNHLVPPTLVGMRCGDPNTLKRLMAWQVCCPGTTSSTCWKRLLLLTASLELSCGQCAIQWTPTAFVFLQHRSMHLPLPLRRLWLQFPITTDCLHLPLYCFHKVLSICFLHRCYPSNCGLHRTCHTGSDIHHLFQRDLSISQSWCWCWCGWARLTPVEFLLSVCVRNNLASTSFQWDSPSGFSLIIHGFEALHSWRCCSG